MADRGSLPRLGALDRWRDEIRLGKRRNDSASFDWLAAAACHEIHAMELAQEGKHREALYWLDAGLLRLHRCWGMPDDKDGKGGPGPGARLLNELKRTAPAGGREPSKAGIEVA